MRKSKYNHNYINLAINYLCQKNPNFIIINLNQRKNRIKKY